MRLLHLTRDCFWPLVAKICNLGKKVNIIIKFGLNVVVKFYFVHFFSKWNILVSFGHMVAILEHFLTENEKMHKIKRLHHVEPIE